MKSLFVCTAILFATSQALAWQKVLDCEEGAAVIDRFSPAQVSNFYQLVIRDPSVIDHFQAKNAVLHYRINSQREMIFPLGPLQGEAEFTGDADARQRDGRIYKVRLHGSGLHVAAYQTIQQLRGSYEVGSLLAAWFFPVCQQIDRAL